jgi:hypothetical protein
MTPIRIIVAQGCHHGSMSSIVDQHPALDFSLFGLAGWEGVRWVPFFAGEVGKPVWSVSLAHSANGALILVKTAPRQWFDRAMVGRDRKEEAAARGPIEFAAESLAQMADAGRPEVDLPSEQHGQYNQGIWPFAESHAARWTEWEPAQWKLGERTLDARVFRFAHGWTGITDDGPDRYIGVTAYNAPHTHMSLAEVDGSLYGFDFSQPFKIQDLAGGPHLHLFSVARSKGLQSDHQLVLATKPLPNWFSGDSR